MRILVLLFLIGLCFFLPANAHAFELGMPIKCHYGQDCFIQNYVDEDPTEGVMDYHRGHLSYDGHDGTDFRLRDYTAMGRGVDVIAAADGVVKTIRDEMEDINVNIVGKDTVMKQGCGNAVVLQHLEGYRTFYCHMKKSSVAVKAGDVVKKGQKLGEVGLSGLTEFPHVHLGVLYQGQKIDPFTGQAIGKGQDGASFHPLWDKETAEKLAYIPTGMLNGAFTDTPPEPEEARAGKYSRQELDAKSKALIFWVDIFGLQPEDAVSLSVIGPDGGVLAEKTSIIPRYKAVFFQYIGKKQQEGSRWIKGSYSGRAIIKRKGVAVLDETRVMQVK